MLKRYFIIFCLAIATILPASAVRHFGITGTGLPTEIVDKNDLPQYSDVNTSNLKLSADYALILAGSKVQLYTRKNGKFVKAKTVSASEMNDILDIDNSGMYGFRALEIDGDMIRARWINDKVSGSKIQEYWLRLSDIRYEMVYSLGTHTLETDHGWYNAAELTRDFVNDEARKVSVGKSKYADAMFCTEDLTRISTCSLRKGERVVVLHYVPQSHVARVVTRKGLQYIPISSLKLVEDSCDMDLYYSAFPKERPSMFGGFRKGIGLKFDMSLGSKMSFVRTWQPWYDFHSFLGVLLLFIACCLVVIGGEISTITEEGEHLFNASTHLICALIGLGIFWANMGAAGMHGSATWFAESDGFFGWFGNTFFQLCFSFVFTALFIMPFSFFYVAIFEKKSFLLTLMALLVTLLDIPVAIEYWSVFDKGSIIPFIAYVGIIIGVGYAIVKAYQALPDIINTMFPPKYHIDVHKIAKEIYDRRLAEEQQR